MFSISFSFRCLTFKIQHSMMMHNAQFHWCTFSSGTAFSVGRLPEIHAHRWMEQHFCVHKYSMLMFDVSIESFSINSPWTDAKYQSKQRSYAKKRTKKNQPNTMAAFIVRWIINKWKQQFDTRMKRNETNLEYESTIELAPIRTRSAVYVRVYSHETWMHVK